MTSVRPTEEVESGRKAVNTEEESFNAFQLATYIVCIMVRRQYSGWQYALGRGFGQFMIAEIFVSVAYLCFFFCISEIWSAIPFSGGGYGLSRAMLGFYPGYLVGCADMYSFVVHIADGALFLSNSLCVFAQLPENATVGIFFALLMLAFVLSRRTKSKMLRNCFMVIGFVTVAILLMWFFGALSFSNFVKNASLHKSPVAAAIPNWFDGGIKEFMTVIPYIAESYTGVRSFTLMTNYVSKPKVNIPRAVYVVLSVVVLNICMAFVFAAQPGGILHTSKLLLPMSVGFGHMFKLDKVQADSLTAILTFPASWANVISYLIPTGALLLSFGKTNLLPSFFCLNHNEQEQRGMLIASILAFLVCVVMQFSPGFNWLGLVVLMSAFSNVCILLCYISMKYNCETLERGFTNPTGLVGAVLTIFMFLFLGFASAIYMPGNIAAVVTFVAMMGVFSLYYYLYAASKQTLCAEEDKVFMMLHVSNYNRNRKKTKKVRNNKVWNFAFSSGSHSNTNTRTTGAAQMVKHSSGTPHAAAPASPGAGPI